MEKEKEIKSIVTKSGSIGYSGKVTVKLSHGNDKPYKIIKQHNTGTADFFVYILNCVRGNNSSINRPYFLQLWDKNFKEKKSNTNFVIESNTVPDKIAETDSHEEDAAQIAFTCFLADNFIAGRSFQGIKLVNYYGVEYARIQLENLVEITGTSTNMAIDWVIRLGNNQVSTEV